MTRFIDRPRDMMFQRKDGSTFSAELMVSALEYEGKTRYAGIVRDITDRKRAEKMKNEFVSTVSHELHTPLTSIKGALGLVLSGAVGKVPSEIQSMVDIAYKNSDRLVRLINDILDIEKIEAGKMEFNMETHSLSDLVSKAIESNSNYAAQYGVSLKLTNVEPNDQVLADADRLQQVFTNLLSNATKFSNQGGSVEVSIARIVGGFQVAVHNDGLDIPKEHYERIFDKFSQVDASDSRQKGGTGLGLHITKSIVETHHGRLYFESRQNFGTTFFVDLPGAAEGVSESTAPNLLDHRLSEPVFLVGESEPGMEMQTSDGQPQILHVEDDLDVRQFVSCLLESVADVTAVGNMEEARTAIESNHFDLVILDLGLPDGDGEELLPILTERGGASVPVVVFSAREVSRWAAQRVSASLTKSQATNELLLSTIRATLADRVTSTVAAS